MQVSSFYLIKKLISHHLTILSSPFFYPGLSLLHHACYFNVMELISLLLNNGADVNLSSEEGDLTPRECLSYECVCVVITNAP